MASILYNHYKIRFNLSSTITMLLLALLMCLCTSPCTAQDNSPYIFDPKLNLNAKEILQQAPRIAKDKTIQQFVDSFLNKINERKEALSPQRNLKGILRDVNTAEGIPFAQIMISQSNYGAQTALDGSFNFTFEKGTQDSLVVFALGYKKIKIPLRDTAKNLYLELDLSRSDHVLREVVVRPGEDPAISLMKKIIAYKEQNNPDKFQNYKYELYNKLELDLVRMTKEQFSKIPLMKPFAFVFDNVDSFSEKKPFLPVYLTETLSDYYFQKVPKKTKEFVKASLTKGLENESVSQFLGGMYQQINMYNNFIDVFDKRFVSPISQNALHYYHYKIMDTQVAYGQKIILLQFVPKRAAENCFVGDMWVVDSVYALQRISMDIAADANINLVNRVSLYQEFSPLAAGQWFNIKDKFIADFTVPYGGKKMPGFIGRKTTSYKNILVNSDSVQQVVNDKRIKQDIIVADDAQQKNASFWKEARHDTLNKNEKAIYAMIDTLNAMPIFNRTKNVISFLAKGTQNWSIFEFGPYWSIYNYNPIEGNRFRYSMGTNPKLFKDIYLNGYVAYGTLDQKFKYKAAGLWLLERHPRHRIYASYTSDIDRSISYYSEAATDNFLSNIVRKKYLPFKLAFVKDLRLEHYKEYFNGFSHELSLVRKSFAPYNPLPYYGIFQDANGNASQVANNTEINLRLRFAYKEKFLEGDYYRISVGTKYPVVALRYSIGLKGFLQGAYNYHKLSLNISDNIKLPHLGTLSYNIFGGKIWGTLPYPLLEIHPGNDYYYYNQYAFSMMNRFEFISDIYTGVMIEHNMGGALFNYAPLLKKAKLRQFWTLKTVLGALSPANQNLNLNKGFQFKTLASSPYLEIGTGVDNIFQLFRVDFVWRVIPSPGANEPLEKRFGIFGSFRVGF